MSSTDHPQPVNESSNVETSGVKEESGRTFSQNEVDTIVSNRVNELNAKHEERTAQAVKEAISEYERRAKLTEKERAEELAKEERRALEERERTVTMRERTIEAKALLAEKNIPVSFVSYIVDADPETTHKNVETLAKTWGEALQGAVKEKLAGTTPQDAGHTPLKKESSTPGVSYGDGTTSF